MRRTTIRPARSVVRVLSHIQPFGQGLLWSTFNPNCFDLMCFIPLGFSSFLFVLEYFLFCCPIIGLDLQIVQGLDFVLYEVHTEVHTVIQPW